MSVNRGDVYYVCLEGTVGSEVSKTRPCIVISNNTGNKFSRTVIILPISSKNRTILPTHTILSSNLEIRGIVQSEQVRTVDKSRLGDVICKLDDIEMRRIEQSLLISLGIN